MATATTTTKNAQVQAEEGPSPLPERNVAQAYSTNDRRNSMKRCALYVLAFFAFVVVSGGGGESRSKRRAKRAKALRKKSESLPESEVQRLQKAERQIHLNDQYVEEDAEDALLRDEDDLDAEVEAAFDSVEAVGENAGDSAVAMLTDAVQTMAEGVKSYLGQAFGVWEDDDDTALSLLSDTSADSTLSEAQMDLIAEKISERLSRAVTQDFQTEVDGVREEKINEIHTVVAEDRGVNMKARDIQHDVQEAETVVLEDLREEIDEAATRAKDDIPNKLKQIRDQVVEEMTGQRLEEVLERREQRRGKAQKLAQMFNEMKEEAGSGAEADAGARAGSKPKKGTRLKGAEAGAEGGVGSEQTRPQGKEKDALTQKATKQTPLKGAEAQTQGDVDAEQMRPQGKEKVAQGSAVPTEMQQFLVEQARARDAMMVKFGPEARKDMEPEARATAKEAMDKFSNQQEKARARMQRQLEANAGEGAEAKQGAQDPMRKFAKEQEKVRAEMQAKYRKEAQEKMNPMERVAAKDATKFIKREMEDKAKMREQLAMKVGSLAKSESEGKKVDSEDNPKDSGPTVDESNRSGANNDGNMAGDGGGNNDDGSKD